MLLDQVCSGKEDLIAVFEQLFGKDNNYEMDVKPNSSLRITRVATEPREGFEKTTDELDRSSFAATEVDSE